MQDIALHDWVAEWPKCRSTTLAKATSEAVLRRPIGTMDYLLLVAHSKAGKYLIPRLHYL
jgi:hypothetical protein